MLSDVDADSRGGVKAYDYKRCYSANDLVCCHSKVCCGVKLSRNAAFLVHFNALLRTPSYSDCPVVTLHCSLVSRYELRTTKLKLDERSDHTVGQKYRIEIMDGDDFMNHDQVQVRFPC